MGNKIYVLTNEFKDKGSLLANSIIEILKDISECKIVKSEFEVENDAKIVLVIGGDGTMLQSIKRLCDRDFPVVGINRGTLGFLTEIEESDMRNALSDIVNGEYDVEERIILSGQASNKRDGCQTLSYDGIAVNDIVFKAGGAKLITLQVFINDKYMDTYVCDGLIFATPTGSTAYNLSAGGPVLMPEIQGTVITPICPQAINKRSIVVPDKDKISVVVGQSKEYAIDKVVVSVDGMSDLLLETGDKFTITRSETKAKIARLKESNVIHRVLTKLNRTL